MQVRINKLTSGKLYKFSYNGKPRKVLVTTEHGDGATCWDFEAEDYRKFRYSQIDIVEELVENTDYTVNKNVGKTKSAIINGVMYTVKV